MRWITISIGDDERDGIVALFLKKENSLRPDAIKSNDRAVPSGKAHNSQNGIALGNGEQFIQFYRTDTTLHIHTMSFLDTFLFSSANIFFCMYISVFVIAMARYLCVSFLLIYINISIK